MMLHARSTRRRAELPQADRLAAAAIYMCVLIGMSVYLNGSFLPPFGIQGLWFYSAAAALLLGEFVLEPFFTRPADALASALAVLIASVTTSAAGSQVSAGTYEIGRLLVASYAVAVILMAVAAMALKDASGGRGRVARDCTRLVGQIGRPKWLFGVLLMASGYAAFADDASKVAALYVTWFVVVSVQPVEACLGWRRARLGLPKPADGVVGELFDPGVAGVRFRRGLSPRVGDVVEFPVESVHGTIVDATSIASEPRARVAVDASVVLAIGSPVTLVQSGDEVRIVGRVASGTDLERLVVATAPRSDNDRLSEGRLLEVPVRGRPTLYQIVEARLVDGVESGLARQEVVVTARKLGSWNHESTRFEPVPWLPDPGRPVTVRDEHLNDSFDTEAIGCIPGTDYGIRIDPHLAVTHNTAILGILGIGKTCLAWELVKRTLAAGIKVVVLDITGRYALEFRELFSPQAEERCAAWLERRIASNVGNRDVREDEAGNYADFDAALGTMLAAFVRDDKHRLLILNPERFKVTRMDGKPYSGRANLLAELSMVDVTRMVAEKLLTEQQRIARAPENEAASLCLVLEEAHSLVPEWNSAVNDGERQAVNGTARAILQGRKYGLGCLMVTQRTANVTKSILNQCNTVFGMRVFDATGMGFLENYIGPVHAGLLASLQSRQAIVFGRASSCNTPVVVNLNDHGRFTTEFWRGELPGLVDRTDPVATNSCDDSGPALPCDTQEIEDLDDIDL